MIQDEQIEALVDEFTEKLKELGIENVLVCVSQEFNKGTYDHTQKGSTQ